MSDVLVGVPAAPQPVAVPPATAASFDGFRYRAYDLMSGTPLGDVPFFDVSFTCSLNGAGDFTGKVNALDPHVLNAGANGGTIWDMTRPSRTALFVDFAGVIVWAGILWTRDRSRKNAGATAIGGKEMWSYFSSRLLAADYTVPSPSGTYWAANPASAAAIALQVTADAAGSFGSPLATGRTFALALPSAPSVPSANLVTQSYPFQQRQSVDTVVSQLAAMGYGIGFDYRIAAAYGTSGVPALSLLLGYPVLGNNVSNSGLVIHTAEADDYSYPEDGTQQASTLYATGSGGTGGMYVPWSNAAPVTAGYPLLEQTTAYANVSSRSVLQGIAQDDSNRRAWPVVTPTVTVGDAYADPPLGSYWPGDIVRWIAEPDENFPAGIDGAWRIAEVRVTVPQQGRSSVELALNMPVGTGATQPPQ